jgi:hypothetical protein
MVLTVRIPGPLLSDSRAGRADRKGAPRLQSTLPVVDRRQAFCGNGVPRSEGRSLSRRTEAMLLDSTPIRESGVAPCQEVLPLALAAQGGDSVTVTNARRA